MPAKRLPPQIYPTETGSWRVTGTVNGEQLKRVVPTIAEAESIKAEWTDAAPLPLLQTRIPKTSIRDAEYLVHTCELLGVTPTEASRYLMKHYRNTGAPTMSEAVARFLDEKKRTNRSPWQIKNLKSATHSFLDWVEHDDLGMVTVLEVEDWLQEAQGHNAAASYNHYRNNLHSFFEWCALRWWIERVPTQPIPQKVTEDREIKVLSVEVAINLLHTIEENHPEWVLFFALCLFSGLRPDVRAGEAQRLNDSLLTGEPVFNDQGFHVKGKGQRGKFRPRFVRWEWCGPLRQWVAAYPQNGKFFPGTGPQAERFLQTIRAKFELSHDVLRHTAASAMLRAGRSYTEVADALGNSETVLRDSYVAPTWSPTDSARLYALTPSIPAKPQALAG